MHPLRYHEGQRQVQREANSEPAADMLAEWVGPVIRYAGLADVVVLATGGAGRTVTFTALSGQPPLVQASSIGGFIRLRFPAAIARHIAPGTLVGGMVLYPVEARRSRFAGVLTETDGSLVIDCAIAFTNCRKYIAPTRRAGEALIIGPASREPLSLNDPRIEPIMAGAITAFLGTLEPDGVPDASHRGGEPGFLDWSPGTRRLAWNEYFGDGMFKSIGNLRAAGRFALLVPDLATGDALEIQAAGTYQNLYASPQRRVHSLVQARERYPVQGHVEAVVESVALLSQFMHPRLMTDGLARLTCMSPVNEQNPS
ncbi:MAG: pyridoxamine 5'-phosphate oxidase family protein [Anaerolineae bacterium]|nr:pyridoxamine 5'-phosphate oxidase family protein [Anaerolineae bacterium]